MKIRCAQPADVEQLVELWVEFMEFHSSLDPSMIMDEGADERWAAYISTKLDDGGYRVLVAEEGEGLTGYTVVTVNEYPPIFTEKRYGFIQEIAVSQAYRGQGIGHRLFEAAEAWLLSCGITRIEAKIDANNELSRAFWLSVGFGRNTETLLKRVDART